MELQVGDLVEHLHDNFRTQANFWWSCVYSAVIRTLIFPLQAYISALVQSDDPTSRGEGGEINAIIRDLF